MILGPVLKRLSAQININVPNNLSLVYKCQICNRKQATIPSNLFKSFKNIATGLIFLNKLFEYKLFQLTMSKHVCITRFFYKQHFYKQRQAEVGKIKQMLSNTLRLNFCCLKIIHILHPRYYPKITVHILKNKQKKKYVWKNKDENEK